MLVRSAISLLALAALCLFTAPMPAKAQASNDDPTGKEIYMTAPACDSYQCKNYWRRRHTYQITWLNAPSGGLKIQLIPESDYSLPTYTVTHKVGSTHNHSKCKGSANGESCGTIDWTVPSNVKLGEYTVAATSLKHSKKIGYTDTVVIRKASSKRSGLEDNGE